MLFNSLHFLVFLPTVTLLYFIIPYRFRWFLLLVASYYFYMSWEIIYVFLILFSTLVSYLTSIGMERCHSQRMRQYYLFLSLFINLGVLFIFKYFNFFNATVSEILNHWGLEYSSSSLDILLPIGISFYTFQTLSYTFDVYNGKQKPEKHFGIFALYVAFFPQLVAGPIERPGRLIPQFFEKHKFDFQRVMEGVALIIWGLFKKIAIADNLAIIVNQVYNQPTEYSGTSLFIATLCFTFQIYCDFSGYSDIAIGAARVMVYNLMDNFDRPYISQSVSEFWKRWHISLSTWFQDYLYIPLGGSRVTIPKWYLNIFIVFVISGIWHGANLTFIIWGALHGLYLILYQQTSRVRNSVQSRFKNSFGGALKYLNILITFSLVSFAWIFFRANSLSEAGYIISHLFLGWSWIDFQGVVSILEPHNLAITVAALILMETVQSMLSQKTIQQVVIEQQIWLKPLLYFFILYATINVDVAKDIPFIYFQF